MPRVPLLVVVGTGVVVVGLEAMILNKGHTFTVEEEAVVVAITVAVKEKDQMLEWTTWTQNNLK
ncbi:hypothetical protein HID58_010163 [Brassica napus]|uniref:Uncharacterized protein n=1 Tax=Brassica napus TaxID=3708 RepID=A0ABQ8DUL2_BRANA|nr:hypothetical protein HID58_010163 [Brassica napus]